MIKHTPLAALAAAATVAAALGCSSDPMQNTTHNPPTGASFVMTAHQSSALDSTGQVVVAFNPANSTLKSLLDSTLQVLTAGITAKRIDLTTDITAAPLYFVGIHRVVQHASLSFSTWTVVGMDDPEALVNLVEINGFAQNATATAPTTLSGTIGTGAVNALFLKVANGGAVTQWNANTGTISFTSDAPTVPCPVPNPAPNTACTIETMHIHFDVTAANDASGGAGRHATVATDVDVPTMRLTYTGQ